MFRFLIFVIIGIAVFVGPQMATQKGKLSERIQQLLKTGDFAKGSAETAQTDWQTTSYRPTQPDGLPAANGPHALPPELQAQLPIAAPVERVLLPLDTFLRFDVTPEWVTHHFDRVTVLPTMGGEGMRVALISGTRRQDLAGSLTYYFDREKVVQRIAMEVETGDAKPVTEFVTKHFKLEEVAQGVYANQFNRVVISGMVVERPSVIQRNQPHTGQVVCLELNRPGNYKQVSRPFHQRMLTAVR